MGKFEIGDKVEVVKAYDKNKVGEIGNITSIRDSGGIYYRINSDTGGAPADFFKK